MSTFLKIILDCSRPENQIILFFRFYQNDRHFRLFVKMSTFQFFFKCRLLFIKMSTFHWQWKKRFFHVTVGLSLPWILKTAISKASVAVEATGMFCSIALVWLIYMTHFLSFIRTNDITFFSFLWCWSLHYINSSVQMENDKGVRSLSILLLKSKNSHLVLLMKHQQLDQDEDCSWVFAVVLQLRSLEFWKGMFALKTQYSLRKESAWHSVCDKDIRNVYFTQQDKL